jgi:sulfofructose kinase
MAKGFSVDVLSTLGAGDVFHGALLAQIIQERPLQEAMLRANAVAALSCLGLDGQSAIPRTNELESFLEANT